MSIAVAKAAGARESKNTSSAIVHRLTATTFNGDEIIADLKKNPEIELAGHPIDFNSNTWSLGSEKLAFTRGENHIRFADTEGDDLLRLYVLYLLLVVNKSTFGIASDIRSVRRVLRGCGCRDARRSLIVLEDYRRMESEADSNSSGSMYVRANTLRRFLRFREAFFGVAFDPDLESELNRVAKATAALHVASSGRTPKVEEEYLSSLLTTCQQSLDDDEERFKYRIVAAAIMVGAQVGMRISELCALDVGSVRSSKMDGKEDIAYLEYRSFKGMRGEGRYKVVEASLPPSALRAYRWLEEHCEEGRSQRGTKALIVVPKQRNRYISSVAFEESIYEYILVHRDTIPCINTAGRFPDLKSMPVKSLMKRFGRIKSASYDEGLSGDDVFVYPTFHMFRVTVATRLYEQGAEPRHIQKRLGHADLSATVGYIRSEREIERNASSLVYKTMLSDGAELIGPHGDEFTKKIKAFIPTLPEHVRNDLDAVVEATAEHFPLRFKVGGVCIRCGNIVPCKRNDETDQIFCAFGVCPNQHSLYYMAPDHLASFREHIVLVDEDMRRGHIKAARNELRKAQNVLKTSLIPEIDSLEEQLENIGREGVLGRFPDLEELVDNLEEVKKEVEQWQTMSI